MSFSLSLSLRNEPTKADLLLFFLVFSFCVQWVLKKNRPSGAGGICAWNIFFSSQNETQPNQTKTKQSPPPKKKKKSKKTRRRGCTRRRAHTLKSDPPTRKWLQPVPAHVIGCYSFHEPSGFSDSRRRRRRRRHRRRSTIQDQRSTPPFNVAPSSSLHWLTPQSEI